MQTTHDALQAIRDWYTGPDRWTQGTYARDADGNVTMISQADKLCIAGAFHRCGIKDMAVWDAMAGVAVELYDTDRLVDVNDGKGYEAIDRIINEALERTS